MIDLSNDDSIIGYLSWAEANNINPFGNNNEVNIFDNVYDNNKKKKEKVKTKNKKNPYGGYNGF